QMTTSSNEPAALGLLTSPSTTASCSTGTPPRTTPLTDPLPDGEEIWVRRDSHDRAGLSVKRELAVVFHSLSILVLRPLVIYVMFFFIRRALHSAWGTSYPLITLAIALGVPLLLVLPTLRLAYPLWLLSITRSRFCPTWLYAEQLNPERL